jgi:hypothetical protein
MILLTSAYRIFEHSGVSYHVKIRSDRESVTVSRSEAEVIMR